MESFDAVDLPVAERVLRTESDMTITGEDAARVAARVERELPALKWAGRLARTMGWRPLCDRLGEPATLFRTSPPPWQADVARIRAELDEHARDVLDALSSGGGGFTWKVLERVVGNVDIEVLARLEEAGLLVRRAESGVVTFKVPFCVRALTAADMRPWVRAWNERAREIEPRVYGRDARVVLAELACAIPMAEHALEKELEGAAELFVTTSDAIFFHQAIPFESRSFDRAVAQAPEGDMAVRARLVAARAALETGNLQQSRELTLRAKKLSNNTRRAEIARAFGWLSLADGRPEESAKHFEEAKVYGDVRGAADAEAGLGVIALTSGDAKRAKERFDLALATHVVTEDEPRRIAVEGMMALLPEGIEVDLGALEAHAFAMRSQGHRWREALAYARLGLAARRRGDEANAEAMLREARIAASISKMPVATIARAQVEPPTLVVAQEAVRFSFGDDTHELGRHGPLRRLLWTLAVARDKTPGKALTTFELVQAAWPDEKIKPQAATLRLYTTMKRLRQRGLERVILTRQEGYLIDPSLPIRID